MSTGNDIALTLSGYPSISLDEINRASLMRRKDRKYMFSVRHLASILEMVRPDYRVLEIGDQRIQEYHTAYYDTGSREMYHKHHRGKANRHKVRIRRYGTTDLHFLEVKLKNAKGVTSKKRIQTKGMGADILIREQDFLTRNCPYLAEAMGAALENRFSRITLVSLDQHERATLDFGLCFSDSQGQELELPGVAIAEIKYEGHLSVSALHQAIRSKKVTPQRFSKYATGMALLNPELKQNRFKERIRRMRRIDTEIAIV